MADLALQFGGDLSVGPTGDLALSDGPPLTIQRVLRRLLTNGGDYIWQLAYGASLAQFVGKPGAMAAVAGIAKAQISLEAAVAPVPAPVTITSVAPDGSVTLTVQYADAATGQTSQLSFSI